MLYPKDDKIVWEILRQALTRGNDNDNQRGTQLRTDFTALKLLLINAPRTPTRTVEYSQQQDTCPHLTWVRFTQRLTWQTVSGASEEPTY